MGQDHFDEAKPMDQYTEEERHRDDPPPIDEEAERAAENEWMRQQAMEMFARMEYRRDKERMREEEYEQRMRRSGYNRIDRSFYYNRYNSYNRPMSEDEEQQLREIAGPLIGIIVALCVGFGCGASEMGTYLILAGVGYYLGLFFKHHATGTTTALEAFQETRPGLFIALGVMVVGLISYFKPLF